MPARRPGDMAVGADEERGRSGDLAEGRDGPGSSSLAPRRGRRGRPSPGAAAQPRRCRRRSSRTGGPACSSSWTRVAPSDVFSRRRGPGGPAAGGRRRPDSGCPAPVSMMTQGPVDLVEHHQGAEHLAQRVRLRAGADQGRLRPGVVQYPLARPGGARRGRCPAGSRRLAAHHRGELPAEVDRVLHAQCSAPARRPGSGCAPRRRRAAPGPAGTRSACRAASSNREIHRGLCMPKSVPATLTRDSRSCSNVAGSSRSATRSNSEVITRYQPGSNAIAE